MEKQLAETKKDKERFWDDKRSAERIKEEAERKWWEQFEYNRNLLNERKQLTEGEGRLKDQHRAEKEAIEKLWKSRVKQKNIIGEKYFVS